MHHHLGHNPRGVLEALVSPYFLTILTSRLLRPGRVLGLKKKLLLALVQEKCAPSVVLRMRAYGPSAYSSPARESALEKLRLQRSLADPRRGHSLLRSREDL